MSVWLAVNAASDLPAALADPSACWGPSWHRGERQEPPARLPPWPLPGKKGIYNRGAATAEGCCLLLLRLSWPMALQLNLPCKEGFPHPQGTRLSVELCARVTSMCEWWGPLLRVGCDTHLPSAGMREWQCSRPRRSLRRGFQSKLCSQPLTFSPFFLSFFENKALLGCCCKRSYHLSLEDTWQLLHVQKQKWKLWGSLKEEKRGR